MKSKRKNLSSKLKEEILKEFSHRCAMCGHREPQIHHIDEDPSNTVAENLIPLCPNCHLQDLHDPTSAPDPLKVKLFRRVKDPVVLDPRFDPLWRRLRFLSSECDMPDHIWEYYYHQLLDFVGCFKMGAFYKTKISGVLQNTKEHFEFYRYYEDKGPYLKTHFSSEGDYALALREFRAHTAQDLCLEMFRYQDWNPIAKNKGVEAL